MSVLAVVAGGLGALAFGALLGVPRSLLHLGALCGTIATGVDLWLVAQGRPAVVAIAAAAFLASAVAEALARWRKCPATLFLVPGIIPLVPGIEFYQAMFAVVSGHPLTALSYAGQALLWGAGIAGGVAAVSLILRAVYGGAGSQRW